MKHLLIFEYLEQNAKLYPDEVALVEVSPKFDEKSRITWKDYSLVQPVPGKEFRREMTWKTFDERANMFANLLFTRGIRKGEKVAILLMNSIEWLPMYFGILKTGAVAVPLNYRYDAQEIKYCLEKADCSMLVFGPEFVGRVEEIVDDIPDVEHLFYVGEDCPSFADSAEELIKYCSKEKPNVEISIDDNAAIYYSSGTTGFPKAILHAHRSLEHAAICEQKHHGQTHDDVFLCIPPLYHTGAKMHWFGSLVAGGKAVLLKGIRPEWILRAVSTERCTIVWLLVPWAQDILDAIDRGDIDLSDHVLDQWRLMHIGAQPVPHSLIERWMKRFPNHQYDTNYGLSESIGPGCIHLGVENIDHVGAIGVPVFAGFKGGIGALLGTTGGYIIGFLGLALVYWLLTAKLGGSLWVKTVACVLGLAVCYAFGTAWFLVVYAASTGPIGLATALGWCVIPFLLPDAVKLGMALVLAQRLARYIK